MVLLNWIGWCQLVEILPASAVHCSVDVHYLESGGHQLEKVNDTRLVGNSTATSPCFTSAVWFATMLKLLIGEILPSFCCLCSMLKIRLCCWCLDLSLLVHQLLLLPLEAAQLCSSIGNVDASSCRFYPASTVKLLNWCILFGLWWSSIGIEEGQQYKFGQQVFNVTIQVWSAIRHPVQISSITTSSCSNWIGWCQLVEILPSFCCPLFNWCALFRMVNYTALVEAVKLLNWCTLFGKTCHNTNSSLSLQLKVLLGESSPAFAVSGVCSMLKMGLCCWCFERSIRHHTLCKPLPLLLLQAVQWCYSIGLVDASSWKFYPASAVHCSIGVYYLESGGHQLEKVNDTGLVGNYTATSLSFASAVGFVTMLKLLLGEVLPRFCCLWCLLDVEDGLCCWCLDLSILVYPAGAVEAA